MKHKKKLLAATAMAATMGIYEIIVDDLQWWTVQEETRPKVIKLAESVVYVSFLGGYRCVGTVIAPETVITNHHCLNDSIRSKVTADFVEGAPASQRKWFQCDKPIFSNERLDYSITECPGLDLEPVPVDVNPVSARESIFLIHQQCDYKTNSFCKPYKRVSNGEINSVSKTKFRHNADSLAGSSGSTIYREATGAAIGLHNSGYGGDSMGRGIENGAIQMRKVVESLPGEFRSKLNVIGDYIPPINQVEPPINQVDRPVYVGTIVKKKSFKCKFFGWLFRKKCK